MEKIYGDVNALNAEIQAAGAWVFAGGLHPSSTATVVRLDGDEVLITDGPFAEAKEWVAGFDLIDLSISEPSLETVFINLTGKELRED
jgi:hypothetical protein